MSWPQVRMIARLLADSTLSDLNMTAVRPILAAESDTYPMITFSVDSAERILGMNKASETRVQTIGISCFAESYQAAWNVAAAVEASLTSWTDDEGANWEWLDGPGGGELTVFEGSDVSRVYQVRCTARVQFVLS